MTKELIRFKEITNQMSIEELDFSNMVEKKDKNVLRGELDFILKRQGFEYKSEDIIDVFSLYKLNEMIAKSIDLIDMDRWNVVEKILKKEVTFKDAMYIVDVLWEEDIEILELS